MPKITIVCPTFNYGRFIRDMVDSVIAQTFKDWELIIVDDGSMDDTQEILATYKDKRIKVFYKENGGIGSALNYGFERATGKYETWLASDNKIDPKMLETFNDYLDKNKDIDFVYSAFDIYIMDSTGVRETTRIDGKLQLRMEWVEDRLYSNYYLGMCWLWRKEIRIKSGEYQDEPGEDYDMVLKMYENGGKFAYIDESYGWYRYHNKNMSHQVFQEDDPEKWAKFAQRKSQLRRTKREYTPKPEKLKVLIINSEFDCAGVGWTLKEALQSLGHEAKHVTGKLMDWNKNTDLLFNKPEDIYGLCEWADVLHFNQWIWTYQKGDTNCEYKLMQNAIENPYERFFKNKKVVYHFHGGLPQLDPEYFIDECNRVNAKMIKCDPFTKIEGATWLPNALDINKLKPIIGYSNLRKGQAKISVANGLEDSRRTNKYIKFMLDYLKAKYCFEYRFFHDMNKEQCLQEREPYDVSIDNTTQGFIGMWGWESLAMGQILIARLLPEVRKAYESLGPGVPIWNANNIDELAKHIRFFARNNVATAEGRGLAREWMEKYYTYEKIGRMYVDFYEGMYDK